jgi:hypothetical protein
MCCMDEDVDGQTDFQYRYVLVLFAATKGLFVNALGTLNTSSTLTIVPSMQYDIYHSVCCVSAL